jgi:hypothetical protein
MSSSMMSIFMPVFTMACVKEGYNYDVLSY